MCCVRYGGIDARIASTSESMPTMPVVPAYAPSITMAPPSGLPRSAATLVARTRMTVTGAAISVVNVSSFTSTRPSGRSFGSTGAQNSSCMPIADHVFDTTGGASMGPSPTTTVLSVLPPRIIPPYRPRYMTVRPSSAPARASTCAESCTPWPPMPVINSSRSTSPRSIDAGQAELHQPLNLALARDAPVRDRVVHARERKVAYELGVVSVPAERLHRGRERREHLGTARREVGGKEVGEPRAVARERAGRLGRVVVARLRHHAADPTLHLLRGVRGARHPAGEVAHELALPVGEDREEQRVLRREVAVERLVREPRLLHDRPHLRGDAPGPPHHHERGVDQLPGLGRVDRPPVGHGPVRDRVLHPGRNNVLHSGNTIPIREPAWAVWLPATGPRRFGHSVSGCWRRRSTMRVRWIWPVAAVRGRASTVAT